MTQDSALEELILAGNACFGCGEANGQGLHVSMYRDPGAPGVLRGEFRPGPSIVGIPGVTHGGAIYTAMDCMATWSGMVLKGTKAMWVLRSAATTYHRPGVEGDPVSLSSSIEEEGGEWDAIKVRVEARNSEDQLLVEGTFKVIPLPPERFKAIVGIDELPDGWADWLAASRVAFSATVALTADPSAEGRPAGGHHLGHRLVRQAGAHRQREVRAGHRVRHRELAVRELGHRRLPVHGTAVVAARADRDSVESGDQLVRAVVIRDVEVVDVLDALARPREPDAGQVA